jgi:predicted transcriptional regulator
MIKNIIALTFLLIPTLLRSQDGILFKVVQKENKHYRSSTTLTTESKINYQADESFLSRLKEKGVHLPIVVKQHQIFIMSTSTGEKNSDGKIPFSGKLDSIESTQYINDKLQDKSNSASFDTTFGMSGFYDNDSTIINEIHGRNIAPSMKEALKNTISQTLKSVKFPKKPIRVGESFSQSVPISIPVQGVMEVKMIMLITYTLKDLNLQFGYFDIIQDYSLTSDMDSAKVSMAGNGHGKMIYDRTEHQMTSMTTQSSVEMKVTAGTFAIISDSNTDTEMLITIKSDK